VMSLSKNVTDLENELVTKSSRSLAWWRCSHPTRVLPIPYLLEVLVLADGVIGRLEEALQIVDHWDAEAAQPFIASQQELSNRFHHDRIMNNGRKEGGRAISSTLVLILERVSSHANLAEYVMSRAWFLSVV